MPKVIAAVGVIVEFPVNTALLVAFNVRGTVLTVKLLPKFIVPAARVVKVPPDLLYPSSKLIVPAAVIF